MRKGQRIRLRRSSPAAREWGVPANAEGTVICEYRLFKDCTGACERVDVYFNANVIIWGAPAKEFEPISDVA